MFFIILGAAVTISSPHFYQSDPGFRKKFDGISDPNLTPERYETYMLVEKYTGAALSLHKRLQVSEITSNISIMMESKISI